MVLRIAIDVGCFAFGAVVGYAAGFSAGVARTIDQFRIARSTWSGTDRRQQ